MKIKTIKRKLFYIGAVGIGVFLLFIGMSRSGLNNDKNTRKEILKDTVLVSEQSDPYYGLAQKIAQTEKLEIVQDLNQALKFNPRFVIWVASPDNLTKDRFLNVGRMFHSLDYYPGLGIISGSTIEKAEQLWVRRDLAQAGSNYVGGDVETTQLVYEPTLFNISDGANAQIELNKGNLIDVLKKADYLYWARHTGATTWFWNAESEDWGENDELFSKDIPQLKPVVLYAPACNNFRPWVKNSIALGFVDNGAAAYLGHTNSPHTNTFLKRGLSVPGISSWKEFPLGLVAQVQNKVATRVVFSVLQFFMLGDPRIYLSKDRPYEIISDVIDADGKRILDGESSINGVLAVKIENGAEYDFLAVKGLTSVGENDLFHNSKLETMNLARDKYVLFLHNGGHFQIELSGKPPLGWGLADALTDALDYSWVVLWLNVEVDNSPLIYAISLLIFIVILLFKILRRKRSIKEYQKVFVIAFILALLRLVYFLVRVDDYSVSANFVSSTALQVALGCAGIFAGAAGGLMLMKDTNKIVVKSLGIVFAVLPQFLLTGFYLVFITFMNTVMTVNSMTAQWLWNYNAFWLPLIVLVFETSLILAVYRFVISGKTS